ncbi:MAG: sulfatase-like hydrolase/transferase [Candidatus Aminicenantes bacterium]|nr:sulfatase-like hydrolase/transferase [Candidatus Aminicenantes bacterium]
MKKKVSLVMLSVFFAAIILFFFNASKKPLYKVDDINVLLITLDTTRADYIGAYGHKDIKTPNIDRLCRKGVMFQNCYSPVPLTLPAHCSIFTGKYPVGHNVRVNGKYYLAKDDSILTRLLKKKGYHTYACIASFVLLAKFGLNQGFDIYDDSLEGDDMHINFKSEVPANSVYLKFKQWFEKNYFKKFFSWVHFYDPHKPYRPPAEYIKKGSETDKLKRYAGEIEFVDKYVGKIIDDLRSTGVMNKTMVIIIGDHGEAFGEHLEYGHSIFCYEEILKVPLIFYNERIFGNHMIRNRVNLVDILPTILDLLDMEIPADVQGNSFVPMLHGDESESLRTFYFESMYGKEDMNWAPLTGIIAGDYKYISLPESELYNLKVDRHEKNNIFKKEFKISKEYDKKLRELILKYSNPASAGKSKRKLSGKDIQHLKSLGYISTFSSKDKGSAPLDPKQGVLLDNKLRAFAEQIEKGGNLDHIEKELKGLAVEKSRMQNPIAFNLLYNIYKKKKNLTSALNILEEGLKIYPDYVQFRFTLANHFFNSKKYDEAIKQCKHIIESEPIFTSAYILLGDVYYNRKNLDLAVKNYGEAVKLEPENVKLKIKYAEMLMEYKKNSEAVNIYNSLIDKAVLSTDHNFLYKIALLNAQYGGMDVAERIFKRLLEIKPGGRYYFYYALLLNKNNKIQEALTNMEIAIEKYPGDLTSIQKKQAFSALNVWRKRL